MNDYGHTALQYRQADLGSMTPERLVVALYERMLRDLEDARTDLASDRKTAFNSRVVGIQNIVTELRNALDHEIGGDLARNLDAIYDYVFQELLLSIVDRDPAHLDDCTTVLEPLLDAWRQVPAGAGEQERRRRSAIGRDPAGESNEGSGGSSPGTDRSTAGVSTLSVTV
jgi:flagellar protein FliS